MFGYPACHIKKKFFACIWEGEGGIKNPEQVTNLLVGRQGIVLFQPIGRKWINCLTDTKRCLL